MGNYNQGGRGAGYGGGSGGQGNRLPPGDRGGPNLDRRVSDPDLWGQDYLKDGYFEPGTDGALRLEYVSRAKVEPLVEAMAGDKLTTGQIRRFFQHCRGVEAKLRAGAPWGAVRPTFQFIEAAAADARGKRPQKIPDLFYDFICRNVAAVKTKNDFLRGFLPHFEAVVGFGSGRLMDRY